MDSFEKCIIERQKKARTLLEESNLSSLLITDRNNLYYLSGYTGDDAWGLLTKKELFLYTDFRNAERASLEICHTSLRETTSNLYSLVSKDCNRFLKKKKALGVESNSITLMQSKHLKKAIDKKLKPTNRLIEQLRSIKDAGEITKIRKSADIVSKTWNQVYSWLKSQKTISEYELFMKLECYMRERGAQRTSFQTIVAAQRHAAMPHPAFPGKIRYSKGPLLNDFGAVYKEYCSDLTRTVFFARLIAPDRWFSHIYQIVLEAQESAIAAIKPGIVAKDIDGIARQIIDEAGYGEHFGHALGHGIGLAVHESPRISKYSECILKPGMVFSVEPGIYLQGKGGVRIEDMVLVTEDGCEVLTKRAKKVKTV